MRLTKQTYNTADLCIRTVREHVFVCVRVRLCSFVCVRLCSCSFVFVCVRLLILAGSPFTRACSRTRPVRLCSCSFVCVRLCSFINPGCLAGLFANTNKRTLVNEHKRTRTLTNTEHWACSRTLINEH